MSNIPGISRLKWASLSVALIVIPVTGAEPFSEVELAEFKSMSLEELMGLKVSSVARKEQSAFVSPAAVYVITGEDLRRSGVTSIPEALRVVPGLQVARVNSHQWAISSRGFNDPFANKLLVLQDGRSVYTPLFSGVFWEELDTVLADVDRIEVIRGPGASLWGANAVNGVINVITKSARDTQGLLVSGGGGSYERGFANVRYGGKAGDEVHYRVYGKYFDRAEFTMPEGGGANDAWWMGRGGFRVDWEPTETEQFTLQGDIYGGLLNQTRVEYALLPPYRTDLAERLSVGGGNALARWTHDFSEASDLALQINYDRTRREMGILEERRETFDVDLQVRFPLGTWQELVSGVGYRFSQDWLDENSEVPFDEPHRGLHLASAFVQDEMALVADRLHLTLGVKLEHHDYTGLELQPNARLAWMPVATHTAWASVSRAVRTPSRTERDGSRVESVLPPTPLNRLPTVIQVEGNPDYGSEELLAYELGYRAQLLPTVTFDVAAFYNVYDELRSGTASQPRLEVSPPPPRVLIPITIANGLDGESYGVEVAATYKPVDYWRLQANYTFLQMQLHAQDPAGSPSEAIEGENPNHQFVLRSGLDWPKNVEWDVGIRYVDRLPSLGIPAYAELDVRVAWQLLPNVELAIVGLNLLRESHQEFRPVFVPTRAAEVPRSVHGELSCRF